MAPARAPGVEGVSIRSLVGRRDEQRDLTDFATEPSTGLTARLIEGPPGSGKTALLEFGVAEARAAGLRVLRATPTAAESSLPYASLGDLLGDLVQDSMADLGADLPGPQRRALDAALLTEDALDEGDGQHAVARALLTLLRGGAPQGLMVAIDDLQWLDAPSSRALLFAVRRLADAPLRLLLARRPGEATDWHDTVRRVVPDLPAWRVPLGPLGVDEIASLLGARLGLQLPRPAIAAIHRRCEGNPLFALEIGRALRERGGESNGHQPPTDDLAELLAGRLRALSAAARLATLGASLASQPTVAMLETLAGNRAVDEAVAASVLQREDERVRFVHPLLATVAESLATPESKRSTHVALADLVPDEDESLLHRAQGTTDTSAEMAEDLDEAARRAVRRGAPELAAELAEHAARLTPEGDPAAQRRRVVTAADHLLAAGDPQRARAMLEEIAAGLGPGPERADVLWRLADAVGDDLPLSTRLAEYALAEAGDDSELGASIRLALGVFTWLLGDLWASAGHVREAARLAELTGDRQLLAVALGEVMHAEAVLGVRSDPTIAQRALELEQGAESFPAGMRPSFQRAVVDVYTDRLTEARGPLEDELRRTEASGDESARVAVLFRLSELELRAGNWGKALRLTDECTALALQAGIEQEQCVALNAAAAVAAHLGRVEDARRAAGSALAIAVEGSDEMSTIRARGTLGFVALSVGDMPTAGEWLAPAMESITRLDIGELSIYNVVQNQLEVLVGMSRLDEAESLVGLLERKAGEHRRAWHLAIAARGRALIAAARGALDEAITHTELALQEHERLPQPFERARTLLVKGSIERRHAKRAAARATLGAALDLFDDLGAALWAETAAAELASISGRAPASSSLTPTERQVTALVVEGLSNAEVAGRLVVNVRTVEAHLSRTYAKLGLRSRVDLVRWATSREGD